MKNSNSICIYIIDKRNETYIGSSRYLAAIRIKPRFHKIQFSLFLLLSALNRVSNFNHNKYLLVTNATAKFL